MQQVTSLEAFHLTQGLIAFTLALVSLPSCPCILCFHPMFFYYTLNQILTEAVDIIRCRFFNIFQNSPESHNSHPYKKTKRDFIGFNFCITVLL